MNTWLYDQRELNRLFLAPWLWWSEVNAGKGSSWSAGHGVIQRLLKRYPKPTFDISFVGKGKGRRPVVEKVIHTTPFCVLREFDIDVSKRARDTVFLVAPLSGHYATLLRDTVHALVETHRVVITDWSNARDVPLSEGAFSLDDYVRTVQESIRLLGPDIHVMAVCQPVVPVLAAVSLMAQAGERTPRSLVLMGGPVDARVSPTEVCRFAAEHSMEWFSRHLIHTVPGGYAGAGRQVYPGFLQHMGFVAMNPHRHMKAYGDFFKALRHRDDDKAKAHEAFYDEYNAVLDMPAEYYLDTVRVVFKDYLLARGEWEVGGVRVDPSAIRKTALLTLEGSRDDISAPGQTRAAQDLCHSIPSDRRENRVIDGVGHYGLFSGRRWRTEICPLIVDFMNRC